MDNQEWNVSDFDLNLILKSYKSPPHRIKWNVGTKASTLHASVGAGAGSGAGPTIVCESMQSRSSHFNWAYLWIFYGFKFFMLLIKKKRTRRTWPEWRRKQRIINGKHLKWQRDTFKHHYFFSIWTSFFDTLNWFQFAISLSSFRFDINSHGNHQTTLISLCNHCCTLSLSLCASSQLSTVFPLQMVHFKGF